MADNPVTLYLGIDEVFPDAKKDFFTFRNLLAELSLTDTLFWCARINLILSNARNPNNPAKQNYIAQQFLAPSTLVSISRFLAWKNIPSSKVLIFHRPQLLELFRWACLLSKDKPNDGDSFNNSKTIETFCRAALIASDIWARRIMLKERFNLDRGLEKARLHALDTVRKNFEASNLGMDPLKALGRSYAIFCEHFTNHCPNAKTDFALATGLSFEAYIACSALIVTHYLDITPESIANEPPKLGIFHVQQCLNGANPGLAKAFTQYLNLKSRTVSEFQAEFSKSNSLDNEFFAGQFDYNVFRQTPILRTNDNRAIVIDPVLFTENILVGPLFHLIKRFPDQSDALFSAFGKSFESYGRNILVRMFLHHHPKPLYSPVFGVDGAKCRIEITDGIIKFGHTIFMTEFKAVWLREDKMLTTNSEAYLQELRIKYGASPQSDKGVAQLAKAIANLAGNTWTCDNLSISTHPTVVPILVANDSLISTPLHSSFFAEEFKRLLCPDSTSGSGHMMKGKWKVFPLVIISIQDLEALETSTKYFSFRECIMDYNKACPDRIVSFNNFISTTPKYKMRHSVQLIEYSEKALRQAHALMRGGSI